MAPRCLAVVRQRMVVSPNRQMRLRRGSVSGTNELSGKILIQRTWESRYTPAFGLVCLNRPLSRPRASRAGSAARPTPFTRFATYLGRRIGSALVLRWSIILGKSRLVQPFVKWAGGKRQLLPSIRRHMPKHFRVYFEPFLGGGAVLFAIQPGQAVVNDVNAELIATYEVIRDAIDELINELTQHQNAKEYFYALREVDRQPAYQTWSPIQKAARLIFLNKTCFNGLFRVNSRGQFNVPFGDYKNPNIVNEGVLRAVNHYFNTSQIQFLHGDFADAVDQAERGDLVYFDPPYDPLSPTASFTGYSLDGFGRAEQTRLKTVMDDLTQRGCQVMLSNSSTPFIRDLYRDYRVVTVEATRAINSDADGRGKVDEVLVMNYGE